MADTKIRRALLSVSDKHGLLELARGLAERGVELLSTGGTARLLADNRLPVVEVSDHTGFPEMMDGRLKTLHPRIHGGILGRRGVDDAIMREHQIAPIDLVVVNLYPFQATIERPDCDLLTAIENIDIGGPALLRAAAKNHMAVTVVVDPEDYPSLLRELGERNGAIGAQTRFGLARKAFRHTADYDSAIADYLERVDAGEHRETFPASLRLSMRRAAQLRYGENPHQAAAFYLDTEPPESCVGTARQLRGKELSFNNLADTDAALECVKQFQQPACVIVKHANPCGVAQASDLIGAYEAAFQTDPTSAFGGIIAFNRPLDEDTALAIVRRQFVEVIVAPEVSEPALRAMATKPNVRVLACGTLPDAPQPAWDYRRVIGGMLVQDRDLGVVTEADLRVVSRQQPNAEQLADLLFAWRVAKFVKSNAIVYARHRRTIGVGAGQMSRVVSARIAALKAADEGLTVAGSVMASDAFFPFRDGIDAAAEAGVGAVIQPGGSQRDDEVIAAANEHGLAMVFTGMRHFRH